MKPIRQFQGPIPGLINYRRHAGGQASWSGYRKNQSRYLKLMDGLTALQHGLCGYCESSLREDDRQVEHVVPQSHSQHGKRRALDPTNLIACCGGGKAQGANVQSDVERYGDESCGQAKGNISDPDFIDPRVLPELPSLMHVRANGQIEADSKACEETGVTASRVERTIELLNLNVQRLQRARQRHRRKLGANAQHFTNGAAMEQWACQILLPKHGGRLNRFFTTSRSYFGPVGERVLAQKPRAWV